MEQRSNRIRVVLRDVGLYSVVLLKR
jgi:hypothetical protein